MADYPEMNAAGAGVSDTSASGTSVPENFLKYIGTSGGRFSMIKQKRSTGGLWMHFCGLNAVIDPGPGALLRITQLQLDPEKLDAVILTHKHIDHSNDVNIMIECMTHGGFEKRGTLIAPSDALYGEDRVVLRYYAAKPEKVIVLHDGEKIKTGSVEIEPVALVHHNVETYGCIFSAPGFHKWGIVSDTKYLPIIAERFSECEFVSLNVTFPNPKNRLEHMSVEEAKIILQTMHPKLAVLTHLGSMLTDADSKEKYFSSLDTPTTKVIPAYDGMTVDLKTCGIQ